MEEVKSKFGRGRRKGEVKKISHIVDPILGKFRIEVSKEEFNVIEEGKDKPIAHCASLEGALRHIIKKNILDSEKTFTISGYINEYRETLNKLKEALNE